MGMRILRLAAEWSCAYIPVRLPAPVFRDQQSAQLWLAVKARMCTFRLQLSMSVHTQISCLTGSRWQTFYCVILTRNNQTSVDILRCHNHYKWTDSVHPWGHVLRSNLSWKWSDSVNICGLLFCQRSRLLESVRLLQTALSVILVIDEASVNMLRWHSH